MTIHPTQFFTLATPVPLLAMLFCALPDAAPTPSARPDYVLASDNCYLYRNLAEHKASATFSEVDRPANIRNQARMIELAGSVDRVVPGHDPRQFERFPAQGRIARIR